MTIKTKAAPIKLKYLENLFRLKYWTYIYTLVLLSVGAVYAVWASYYAAFIHIYGVSNPYLPGPNPVMILLPKFILFILLVWSFIVLRKKRAFFIN